jgi:LytS/YehU family sensor histidine kinase
VHGIARRPDGGTVRVIARRRPGAVELRVEADGAGRSSHAGTGTSLADLGKRLDLLYAGAHSLQLTDNDGGGMTVVLILPWVAPP